MTSTNKIRLIVVYAALIARIAWAEDAPSVKADVDKTTVSIGDRIRYSITVESKSELDIKYPDFANALIGDFEIKDSGSINKRRLFGNHLYVKWYHIAAYAVGRHTIPQSEAQYKYKGRKDWSSGKTKEVGILVESVFAKNEKILDIKDIKGPIYFREIKLILILASLVILLLVMLGFFLRSRARRLRPSKSPYELTLEELEGIRRSFAQGGDVKEYYVRISDCVRYYIEITFSINSPEMTTEEFLNSVRDSGVLSAEHKRLLKDFLLACDLVKFAQYAPTRSEIEAVFDSAKKFVDETKGVFPGSPKGDNADVHI